MNKKEIATYKECNLRVERCFKLLAKCNMDILGICIDVIKGAEQLAEADEFNMKSIFMQQGALEVCKIISNVITECRSKFDKEAELLKELND